MNVWALLAKNITLKPASQYLHGTLALLVRYNQAQKCQTVATKLKQLTDLTN